MIQHDFFELLYNYMNEHSSGSIQAHLKKDNMYQCVLEKESYQKYENLNLPEEQNKIIEEYIDSIHDTNSAYSQVQKTSTKAKAIIIISDDNIDYQDSTLQAAKENQIRVFPMTIKSAINEKSKMLAKETIGEYYIAIRKRRIPIMMG